MGQFKGTLAYERLEQQIKARALPRAIVGDNLGGASTRPVGRLRKLPDFVQPCFRSVLQGDHIGVEVATASHEGLLTQAGLLTPESRVSGSLPLGAGPFWDALVIDDYFTISTIPRKEVDALSPSTCTRLAKSAMDLAQAAYSEHKLLGSSEKDIVNVSKAAGAEINAERRTLDRGVALVSAPADKRLSLSALSLEIAAMPATTDALHACLLGAWTSAGLYRRPVLCCLDAAYKLVPGSLVDPQKPKIVPLPRDVAQELVLISILGTVAATDISAPFLPLLFATDSSQKKGAICVAPISRELSQGLWLGSDRKGTYARLATKAAAILRHFDPMSEEHLLVAEDAPSSCDCPSPERPFAYYFDFIEVFAGASVVTQEMSRRGWRVGPPLDLDFSPAYDLTSPLALRWLFFLCEQSRVACIFISPPCTTFSIAANPPYRSRLIPRGFDPAEPRTRLGNACALRGLALFDKCRATGIIGMLENPRSSIMTALEEWKRIARKVNVDTVWTSSCAFGSPHLKQFVFLATGVDPSGLHRKCECTRKHKPVKGKHAKASATYTPGLVVEIGALLSRAIRARRCAIHDLDIEVSGLERVAATDLALSLPWQTQSAWSWGNEVHINILEASTICRLYKQVGSEHGPCRFVNLCDSHVAQSALGKGRSASDGLRHVTRRSSMIALSAGLYPGSLFCPTRAMPADHPTRDVPHPPPVPGLGPSFWNHERLKADAKRPRLRRWASNWVRLTLRLGSEEGKWSDRAPGQVPVAFETFVASRLFDSSLGFPGEGPCTFLSRGFSGLVCFSSLLFGFSPWLCCLSLLPACDAMERPRELQANAARKLRRLPVTLPKGRPVQPRTFDRRQKLKEAFTLWLQTWDITWTVFTTRCRRDADFAHEITTRLGFGLRMDTGRASRAPCRDALANCGCNIYSFALLRLGRLSRSDSTELGRPRAHWRDACSAQG